MRTESVFRIRQTETVDVDAFKQPIAGVPERTEITGAMIAPRESTEPAEPGREPSVAEFSVYFRRARPDITAKDQIEIRGVVCDVIGDPADWRGTRGVGGLVVQARKARG